MDAKKLKLNINLKKIDWIMLVALFILFAPYLFSFDEFIYEYFGKYYYAITGGITFVLFCIIRLPRLIKNIRNEELNKLNKRTKVLIILLLIFALYLTLIFALKKLPFDNYAFACLLLLYFCIFCFVDFNEDTIKALAVLSVFCVVYLIIKHFILHKNLFLNANTYAYFITILMVFFSLLVYIKKSKIGVVFIVILTLLCFLDDIIIYQCRTQPIAFVLLALILAPSKKLAKKPKLTMGILISLCAIIVLSAFIVKILIDNDLLIAENFIAGRGGIFIRTINILFNHMSIFEGGNYIDTCTEIYGFSFMHAHNGFLDACFKFSTVGAVLFIGIIFYILIVSSKKFSKDNVSIFLLYSLVVLLFLNVVEPFLLGLNEAYFLSAMLGVLVSRLFLGKNNPHVLDGLYKTHKNVELKNLEPVTEEKDLSGEDINV